jgi:hypothetical protein
MANILPPAASRAIERITIARVVLITSIFITAFSVALLSLYAPLYLSEEQVSGAEVRLPSIEQDRAALRQSAGLLLELSQASTTPIALFIESALAHRPAGITVRAIRATRNASSTTLFLDGTTISRDAISTYRASLTEDKLFRTVAVPIGVLAGVESGKFSMTITTAR